MSKTLFYKAILLAFSVIGASPLMLGTAEAAPLRAQKAARRAPAPSVTWVFHLKKTNLVASHPDRIEAPEPSSGDPLPDLTVQDIFNQQTFAGKNSGLFVFPGADRRDLFHEVVQKLLKGEVPQAETVSDAGFELIPIDDMQGHLGYALRETIHTGGGLYFFRSGAAPYVIVEAPHPLYDEYTEDQAMALFRELPFRAAYIQTAHRCISNQPHPCGHASGVCAGHSTYRDSDAAHSEVLFHIAHEAAEDMQINGQHPRFLQLHGFEAEPADPRVAVSDGTKTKKAANELGNQLSTSIKNQLQNGKYALSCNDAEDPDFDRCGTKNYQGNYTNNGAGLCGDPESANGRFIHLEQAKDFRENDLAVLCKAVRNVIFGQAGSCTL